MANQKVLRVDFDQIAWLRELFREACKGPGRLFHVTRTVIDPTQEEANDCRPGWEEFRRGVEFFEHASYERRCGGIRHTCYYGSRQRLQAYTGLAAKALLNLPSRLIVMSDYLNDPQFNRDAWTLALYRVSLSEPGQLPVDLQGDGDYALANARMYGWLRLALADASESPEGERRNVLAWQSRAAVTLGRLPQYVYGSLALDVFASSAWALDYLLRNAEALYYTNQSVVLPGPRYYTAPTATQPPRRSLADLIQVDLDKGTITLSGSMYEVERRFALWFKLLVDGNGEWVQPADVERQPGMKGFRADKAFERKKKPIPQALRRLVERKPGAGSRIRRDRIAGENPETGRG